MASIGGAAQVVPGALMAGVIEEARRHRRRRRVRLLAALALAVAAAAAAPASLRSPRHADEVIGSPRTQLQTSVVAPASVLSEGPYLGVACPQPNAIACDRVGLAVSLKRPAISVDATIAGQALKLDWFGEQPRFASTKPRTAFAGYLQPAGLTTRLHVRPTEAARWDPLCDCRVGAVWNGRDAPQPIVELEIHYPDGTRVLTLLRVGLVAH
jgi:hypothetical protein